MLKPSYAELMELLNSESENSEEITSRYTIVIAAAKRARQIIDGDSPMVENNGKPVSEAVDELFNSKIQIVPEGMGTVLDLKKNYEPSYRENEEFDVTNTMMKSDENNENIDSTDNSNNSMQEDDENNSAYDTEQDNTDNSVIE